MEFNFSAGLLPTGCPEVTIRHVFLLLATWMLARIAEVVQNLLQATQQSEAKNAAAGMPVQQGEPTLKAGSSVPKKSNGSQMRHSWTSMDAKSFKVRCGPNYPKYGKKAPSGAALGTVEAMDVFVTKRRISHSLSLGHIALPPATPGWSEVYPEFLVITQLLPAQFNSAAAWPKAASRQRQSRELAAQGALPLAHGGPLGSTAELRRLRSHTLLPMRRSEAPPKTPTCPCFGPCRCTDREQGDRRRDVHADDVRAHPAQAGRWLPLRRGAAERGAAARAVRRFRRPRRPCSHGAAPISFHARRDEHERALLTSPAAKLLQPPGSSSSQESSSPLAPPPRRFLLRADQDPGVAHCWKMIGFVLNLDEVRISASPPRNTPRPRGPVHP